MIQDYIFQWRDKLNYYLYLRTQLTVESRRKREVMYLIEQYRRDLIDLYRERIIEDDSRG